MQQENPSTAQAREAERFRHFIVSVTDYAIYTLSPEGVVITWNAGAQRFKGYREDEIVGRHFSVFYTAEEQARGRPALALEQARTTGKFEDEGWRVRKDGTRFVASVVLDPIWDAAGVLLGFTKITRDVTARRAAQDELHASEERFRLLVQGVTDYAIYMLSPDGVVTNWNEGARRIKGYEAHEVVGRSFAMFYTPEDQAASAPAVALSTALGEGRFEREGWRVRKDGTRFWANVVIDPIRDADGKLLGFAKVTRDITERRLAAEQLERTRESLLQSQKLEAIGKLTGGIAHDFNNLLNVVMNGLDILRTVADRTAQRRAMDAMERAAQRGAALTQQLLAFARQQPLRREAHDVGRVIRSFDAVLHRAVPSRVRLRLRIAPDLPSVLIDPTQFEAALLNLVVNARDAMHDHGDVTIDVDTVRLAAGDVGQLAAGGYVRVAVTDSGTGMAPETVARAVEPFFTTKAVGKGTGLGLSQVYGLAQQCQGDLAITSVMGEGTTVALYFPAIVDADGELANNGHSKAEKVLLVDDQPDVLETAVALFSHLGYDVLSANNGVEALATLRASGDIAILFTDVVMPGIGGIELATIARREFPNVKVILASGYTRSSLQDQSPELDSFDLIPKPYRLSDLIKIVQTVHGDKAGGADQPVSQ
ncbi:PAS domain S-box-containing protein [Duganella sp. CF517]|uniref:hybrid sensor histidine kinase/response regulator n=1 Tax=Duganella sp. CF517 TaxID=1881038 RepID=UPI0008BE417C|nr:PAS domain-containing sensor histidine kinase [Duganella sp. CF517]SEO05072.1 PAS domain S-box-containing protein [Duganella sp. CF517]